MLTKCILKRKGRHHKQLSISKLCDLWEAGPVADLCTGLQAKAQTAGQGILSSLYQSPKSLLSECQRQIACSISLAQDGLLEEACRILCCNGIAKNSHSTFITLQSKHPTSPPPVALANSVLTSQSDVFPPDFNIISVIQTFAKGTACGPSGLRAQHISDALEATFHC